MSLVGGDPDDLAFAAKELDRAASQEDEAILAFLRHARSASDAAGRPRLQNAIDDFLRTYTNAIKFAAQDQRTLSDIAELQEKQLRKAGD